MVEQLQEKLRKIEALHRGATTSGERDAAASAYARVNKRISEMNDPKLELDDPMIELNNSVAELNALFRMSGACCSLPRYVCAMASSRSESEGSARQLLR